MKDLSDRRRREEALAAALLLRFAYWQSRVNERGDDASIDTGTLAADLARILRPHLADTHQAAVIHQAALLGITPPVPLPESDVWAAPVAGTIAGEIAGTTAERLGQIAAGGSGDPATIFSADRAATVAITETTRAITAGMAAAVLVFSRDAETSPRPLWQTAEDERVCPVCAPLNGTGKEVWGRLSPDGPPAHPHCRCWLAFV